MPILIANFRNVIGPHLLEARLKVYYSGGQMLAALAQNFTSIGPTAIFQASVFCKVTLHTDNSFMYFYYLL